MSNKFGMHAPQISEMNPGGPYRVSWVDLKKPTVVIQLSAEGYHDMNLDPAMYIGGPGMLLTGMRNTPTVIMIPRANPFPNKNSTR